MEMEFSEHEIRCYDNICQIWRIGDRAIEVRICNETGRYFRVFVAEDIFENRSVKYKAFFEELRTTPEGAHIFYRLADFHGAEGQSPEECLKNALTIINGMKQFQ